MPFIPNEFLKFIIVGVINTGHYYAVYILMLHGLGLHFFAAHMIGFLSSLIGSFFLNTLYTYKVKPTWSAFIRFPLTQLFNTGMTAVLLYLFVEQFGMNSSIAPLVAVFFTLPATFILTGRILKKPCKKEKTHLHSYIK
ncbi:GtrA family protein [Domibacillus indicus]|uniref:GtrA family protein n=1 Tax=Domibacillus TaxID=1433999 RepID=UPI00203F4272|nr:MULTISPECIES: GtrA family protein [Domibacillus]MCM3790396.1 GtrA family protein [Domibacillus indicus]